MFPSFNVRYLPTNSPAIVTTATTSPAFIFQLLKLFVYFFKFFLCFNHFLFVKHSFIIHQLHHLWQKPLMITDIMMSICSQNRVIWTLWYPFCDQLINRCVGVFSFNKCVWTYIILHNQVWVKRIQIKTHHPIMHSYLWVFYIGTCKLRILAVCIFLWYYDITIIQIVMNQYIPHTHLCED